MPAYAAVWVVVVAVLLAAGLLVMMMASRRPQEGYAARLREMLAWRGRPDEGGSAEPSGVVAELREAAEGETVGLSQLLDEASSRSDAYLSVPQRYEDRFEVLAEGLLQRQRAHAERVRSEREERTSA